jgi:hypothetical protein
MIAAGKHKAVALPTTPEEAFGTKDNGNDFVMIRFQISSGDDAGNEITWWGFFTDKTKERTIEALRHAGCTFPGNDITNLEGLGSRHVELDIGHEEYNGQTRAKINWVNSLGGMGIKKEEKLDAKGLKGFAARMRADLAGAAKTAPGGPPAQKKAATQGAAGGDDIPF